MPPYRKKYFLRKPLSRSRARKYNYYSRYKRRRRVYKPQVHHYRTVYRGNPYPQRNYYRRGYVPVQKKSKWYRRGQRIGRAITFGLDAYHGRGRGIPNTIGSGLNWLANKFNTEEKYHQETFNWLNVSRDTTFVLDDASNKCIMFPMNLIPGVSTQLGNQRVGYSIRQLYLKGRLLLKQSTSNQTNCRVIFFTDKKNNGSLSGLGSSPIQPDYTSTESFLHTTFFQQNIIPNSTVNLNAEYNLFNAGRFQIFKDFIVPLNTSNSFTRATEFYQKLGNHLKFQDSAAQTSGTVTDFTANIPISNVIYVAIIAENGGAGTVLCTAEWILRYVDD